MKKLMMFLMVAIPILVILIVKLTASVAVGDVFISVEYITFAQETVEKQVGESMDMEYYIYPEIATNKEVFWSSNNEEAATVDMNGHVDFVGIGSGYIIATTKDGNKRALCSFYVWDTKVHQVSLSAPQNFLHIGGTLQLTAKVLPDEALDKEVSFSSSDEQIAIVDSNGLVSGLKEGYVTITATSDDGGFSDSVDLSVVKPVTGLVVEKTEVITSSKTEQIEFLIEPLDATNQDLVFEVDNPDVAQVNHTGQITFFKAGEVVVTISTVDGNFTQKVHYIFTDGYAHDLILETQSVTMKVDDAPACIEYQTLPENLYNTRVEFTSDDDDIAFVDSNGYIHAGKGGNTTVRVKVEKSEGVFLEKTIIVNVLSPATKILIQDVVTADKECKLSPNSDGLDTKYFFHIGEDDASKADVSEDGIVTFKTETPCTVKVTIFANEDQSEVSKEVNVTYTAGKASEFHLIDKNLTLTYDDTVSLNYVVLPANATIRPFSVMIEESFPVCEDGEVIEILEDGRIHAIGGGKAKIRAQMLLHDNSVAEDFCEVTVLRNSEKIQIELDLENYKGQYITSQKAVKFSGKVLPDDATTKDITWSLSDKDTAILTQDNMLLFNKSGVVTLTATCGEVSNSVEIFYTGTNPVYAEVRADFKGQEVTIPETIMVEEEFSVKVSKTLPEYEILPQISLQATNQKTSHVLGEVLQINGNTVKGVAGGTATLVVYVANSVRLNFAITVERKPESISVRQAGTQVTTNVVNLEGEILPYDATNKEIRYEVKESDIAFVEGSLLTFKKNGIAHITAISEAYEDVRLEFFIEKIEKEMVHISPEQQELSVVKGDLLTFDNVDDFTLQIDEQSPIVEGTQVVSIEDKKYLRAVSAGTAKVSILCAGEKREIEIVVKQLVEDIAFKKSLDEFNGEYVVAKNVIDLEFEIFPEYSTDKTTDVSILQSTSAEGKVERFAYISNGKLHTTKAGSVVLQVKSRDGNCTKTIRIRFTYGDALDAELNVGNRLVMNVGESVTIGVSKWLPFDVTNTQFSLREVNATGKKVIEINQNTKTILAVDSGETKLVVELSNGIVKEVEILCVNKAKDILVQENVMTANSEYAIEATVIPKNATNQALEFLLQDTTIATIEANVLHFSKAGTVTVFVRTTDGSNIEKKVSVTCTMGYLGKIVLNEKEKHLTKNAVFQLYVDKYPTDATYDNVQFKILSQNAFDQKSSVISLSESGQIVALCSGEAVVRAFALDGEGNEVFADCKIVVFSPLETVDVRFDQPLDQYQNASTFITSRKEISFEILQQPNDAEVEEFSCEVSDEKTAHVEGNKIIFLQKGRVTITFKCRDASGNEKSKAYSFVYVANSIVEATLDKSKIENGTIKLEAGESFEFALEKLLPGDIGEIEFSVTNVVERRNDPKKQVATFENGTLLALNGGTYAFTLYANGCKLEELTLIVSRKATGIEIEGENEVFVSQPHYSIVAHVRESDSQQSELHFSSDNEAIASVTQTGNVTFTKFGECDITISIVDNPAIFVVVKVVYTKELQSIAFNLTRENLFVGEHVDLSVLAVPFDCEEFEYEMKIDNLDSIKNPGEADLLKRENGYRLIGKAAGDVVVTAKVLGKEISVSKTFHIFDKISSITLELDKTGDANGQGDYRVFGNLFFDAENKIVNTYQMNVSLKPSGISKDLLEWSSSNDAIATVDQNGLVTFVGTGRVTITVKQKDLSNLDGMENDSYEFVVVNGINVQNFAQFKIAHDELTKKNKDLKENFFAMVLHDNISIESDLNAIAINYDIFGNGKMIDHSKMKSTWEHFTIRRNNITLDNVVLRGASFAKGEELKNTGVTLMVDNCDNVLFYNCTFENAEIASRIQSSQVKFVGCIFQNILSAGLNVVRSETKVCDILIKDCIFTSSFCGIFYRMDKFASQQENIIKLEGEVRFYNWSTMEQIEQGLDLEKILRDAGLSFVAGEIIKQMKEIARDKGEAYKMVKDGKEYYNFAIFKLTADIPGNRFAGVGRYDKSKLNPSCTYSDFKFNGALNLALVVPFEAQILSILPSQAFIKPGDTYINDNAQQLIKQSCRI